MAGIYSGVRSVRSVSVIVSFLLQLFVVGSSVLLANTERSRVFVIVAIIVVERKGILYNAESDADRECWEEVRVERSAYVGCVCVSTRVVVGTRRVRIVVIGRYTKKCVEILSIHNASNLLFSLSPNCKRLCFCCLPTLLHSLDSAPFH